MTSPHNTTTRQSLTLWLTLFVVMLTTGCASSGHSPLQSLSYPRDAEARQPHLLVMLRGLGADNTVFAKQGVIDEIRAHQLPFDVIAPDAHFGYYQAKTFNQRLKEDIIDPARRQGYQQIWLAGFSMGGLGALLYLRSHPEDIDGILLTSPFLGWPSIHQEIQDAGGLSTWSNTSDSEADWQRMIWSWISEQDFQTQVPIWLGYGESDIVTTQGPPLLASALPDERVFSAPGNHTISTLRTLFSRHIANLARNSTPIALSAFSSEPDTRRAP